YAFSVARGSRRRVAGASRPARGWHGARRHRHSQARTPALHPKEIQSVSIGKPPSLLKLLARPTQCRRLRSLRNRILDFDSESALRFHTAVSTNEIVGRTIMAKVGLGGTLQFRNNFLSQCFAKLDTPLVERIDIPNNSLSKNTVFIKRNQGPQQLGG